MKKLYLFAALAAMLAACSENDLSKETAVQQNAEEGAVQFSAYMSRGTTRVGWPGTLTTSSGTKNLQTEGFGVFGYYTNDELYSQNAKPDFFYNQKVYYSSGWTYSPIKYWPNEFGATAESQAEDRLSFFAYAPYVNVDISTGIAQLPSTPSTGEELETGIISMTRNTALGDPYVKYYASFDPEKCVDLCFGVAKEKFTSSVDGDNNLVNAGMPYLNVKKPKLSDRIFFDFKHALAQLNVQIDADVDEMSHGTSDKPTTTKIYVREVTFEGFADKGMLNLNSEADPAMSTYTPKWVDLSGINEIKTGKVTIYDGRRDGREGQVNAEAPNEKPQNLNHEIISNKDNTENGVYATKLVNLFDGASEDAPILVIPTEEPLSVTIVYDVETEDDNLATFLSDGKTHGSSVENKITKAITLNGNPLKLTAGKSYVVNLHLGMTSVKFDASVTDWKAVTPAADVDLPVNGLSAGSTIQANMMATETTGEYIINGLTDGNTVTATNDDGSTISSVTVTGISGGKATVNYTLAANTTLSNKEGRITVTEKDGSGNIVSVTTINVMQAAAALGLKVKTINGTDDKDIVLELSTSLTGTPWESVTADGDHVKVTKNSSALEYGTGAGKYTFDPNGKIVLGTAPVADDVYTITIQAGDAEEEVVIARVGSISFDPTSVTIGVGRASANPATVKGTGSVTYSSSDASKATVSASGTVTGKAAGSATITATVANDDANGWFYIGTKQATLTVTVKAIATISFANTTVNVLGSESTYEQAVTNSGDGTVGYESSNTAVATVNSSGVVTIVGAGTTTITATVEDGTDNTYPVKTATYTLTVTKANAAISFTKISDSTDGTSYNASSILSVDPTAAGTDGEIKYSLSSDADKDIATINEDSGVVTLKSGKSGTVTVIAKATDGNKYTFIVKEASFNLTFTTVAP